MESYKNNRDYHRDSDSKSISFGYELISLIVGILLIGSVVLVSYLYISFKEGESDKLLKGVNSSIESPNYKKGFYKYEAELNAKKGEEKDASTKAETTTPDATKTETTPTPGATDDSLLKIVNKLNPVSSDYAPTTQSMSDLNGTRVTELRPEAGAGLRLLFSAATEAGHTLYCCSGYRSYSTQASLYQWNVDTYGQEKADLESAKPGTSEHQLGLAMDVTSASADYDLLESFGDTSEGLWLAANAHKYGFVIRYPKGKTSITGYSYEPWHIRYFGVDTATAIFNSGKTVEEYFGVKGV